MSSDLWAWCCYQARFVCPTRSQPNTEMLRSAVEKRFIHEGPGEQFNSTSPKARAWDTYRIKLRHGGHVGKVTGKKKKVRSSWLCAGATKLQASPWDSHSENCSIYTLWGWSFQLSDVKRSPIGHSLKSSWRVSRVPTHLNQLELELDAADTKFLKTNSGKHLTVQATWCLEGREFFLKS